MRGILLLLVLLTAAGCARKTPLPGLHIDQSGAIARTQPADVRAGHEQAIAAELQRRLGETAQVTVAISPEPSEDPRYEDARHWYWREITVEVRIQGPGAAGAPDNAAIGRIVGERLKPQLREPEALKVQIQRP